MAKYYFQKLKFRYHQFGGKRMLKAYGQLGIVEFVAKNIAQIILHHRPLKEFYPAVERKIDPILIGKFLPLLNSLCVKYDHQNLEHKKSDKIWFCWMQGMDKAPELVKVCYQSLQRWLKGKEIIVIDADNYLSFIDMPSDIQDKYSKGYIPNSHYTDLIRLQLLVKYGGTWIDSTVLCTKDCYPRDVLDSDLFLFQHLVKEDKGFHGISSWFISAYSNNKVLIILRDMLFQYWRDYDCLLEYYIFHLFFSMVAGKYPKEIAAMPRVGNHNPLLLALRLEDEYDDSWMQKLLSCCCFHKLNYRVSNKAKDNPDSFYNKIIGGEYEFSNSEKG
jgi:hypothetical protein